MDILQSNIKIWHLNTYITILGKIISRVTKWKVRLTKNNSKHATIIRRDLDSKIFDSKSHYLLRALISLGLYLLLKKEQSLRFL